MAERRFAVMVGNSPTDTCSLCGIERQYAGYLRESCGDGFGKPGCFVIDPDRPAAAVSRSESTKEDNDDS